MTELSDSHVAEQITLITALKSLRNDTYGIVVSHTARPGRLILVHLVSVYPKGISRGCKVLDPLPLGGIMFSV